MENYDPNTSGNGIVGFGIDTRDSLYRLDKFGDFDWWNGTGWTEILNFFSQPNNLFIDRDNNVWLLSNNMGMKRYKNGVLTNFPSNYDPPYPNLMPSGSIHDMVQDSSGIYWIASDDGLIKYNGTTFQLITTQNAGISSNRTRCLALDKKGQLWIGTWDGGVSRFNGSTWQTYNVSNSPLASNIINDISVDSSNRIWIANGYNPFVSPSGGQGIVMLDESIDLSKGRLPVAPGSLQAKVISVNEVNLSWNDSSDNEAGFQLERAAGNMANFQQIKFLAANTTGFTDLTVNGNTTYYYRIRAINSKGASAYSNTIQVQPKYCTVSKANYDAYAIATKVMFGDINNQPFNCLNGYYDYLNQSTALFRGQTLMLTIAFGRCRTTTDPIIGGSVYIDWNNDGDFDDSKELVFNNTNIDGKAEFRIPVTVPDFVVPGTVTRMRIRSEDDVYPTTVAVPPCGYAEETQDYSLRIIDPPASIRPERLMTTAVTSRQQFVEWQDNAASEMAYFLERSTDSISFTRLAELPPNTIQFKDADLQPDTRYYYRVLVKAASDSSFSDVIGSTSLSADLLRQWQGDITIQGGFNVGAFWDDFNNDGNCDIYVSGINQLYTHQNGLLNNSQLSFTNAASAAWGDFDNDGDDDLYLTDYIYGGGSPVTALLENNGNGGFTTTPLSFTPDGRINNAVWTDYNNDGYLDLYLSYLDLGYGKLYRNNRNKTFSLAQQFAGAGGFASFVDYDNDGDDDLVVMGGGKGVVYNKQDSLFTRNTTSSLTYFFEICRGVSWADFDNDGDLDVFVPNTQDNQLSSLYINNGADNFVKNSQLVSMVNGAAFGSAWADFDNDGWQDLFVSRFGKTNKLLRNRQGRLEEMPASVFVSEVYTSFPYDEMPSMGCAWGDYNNDGFLDLYVAVNNGFKSRLYKNGTNQYNWITVTLKGKTSNANAIGAMVKIKANGQWQYRWVQSGTGFSSHNSFPVEFGLGRATVIDSLLIRWPSGIVQTLKNITVNQLMTVTETSITTSVTNTPESTARVFPNPVSQKVFIELKTNEVIREKWAAVYDVKGTMRQLSIRQEGTNLYSLDVRGLADGIHWIEIKGKNEVIRQRIVVLK